MTTAPPASITVASSVTSRRSHPSPRPPAAMTPSRTPIHPSSIAPTSPAAAPMRGRSSFSGASVSRRARRTTRSASAATLFEEARFDDARAVEAVELEGVRRHLQRRVERDQADELAAQDIDPRRARSRFDLVPDLRERGPVEVEDVHRDLHPRGARELEAERLDPGEPARRLADLLRDALREPEVRRVELDVEGDEERPRADDHPAA